MDTLCLAMLDGLLIILVLLHSYNIRESSIMPWHLSQLQLQTYSYIVQHILLRTELSTIETTPVTELRNITDMENISV